MLGLKSFNANVRTKFWEIFWSTFFGNIFGSDINYINSNYINSDSNLNVKAQATVFIILGIIILVGIVGTVYFVQNQRSSSISGELPKIIRAPVEVQPVEDFVASCLKQSLTDSLKSVGERGGYTFDSLPSKVFNTATPTDSGSVVSLSGSSNSNLVPSWNFLESKNRQCPPNCNFKQSVPSLKDISDRASQLSEKSIVDCVNGFDKFREQGIIVSPKSEPKISVIAGDSVVNAVVVWDLQVSKDDKTYSVSGASAQLDLKLKDIYELATGILNLELNKTFFEQVTLDFIDHYSSKSESDIPPTSDIDIASWNIPSWSTYSVKKKLQNYVIPLAISYLNPVPSRNSEVLAYPYNPDNEYFKIILDRDTRVALVNITHRPMPEFSVDFSYLQSWEPYLHLNCKNDVCRPDQISLADFISLPINQYHFQYDVSFPVLISIKDPDALNGRGFTLQYIYEANIRTNKPVVPANVADQPAEAESLTIPSPFNDERAKTSGVVSLSAIDGLTKQILNGTSFVFRCSSEALTFDQTNGSIQTKLPRCVNGAISAINNNVQINNNINNNVNSNVNSEVNGDYRIGKAVLNTYTNAPQNIVIPLFKEKTFAVKVKKVPIFKQSDVWQLTSDNSNAESLEIDDHAIISLQQKAESWETPLFSSANIFGGFRDKDSSKDISLIPGKYNIAFTFMQFDYNTSAFSNSKKAIVIPPQRRGFGSGNELSKSVGGGRKHVYIPEKPIVFNQSQIFAGGSAAIEFELTPEEYSKSNPEITFFVPFVDLVSVPESSRIVEDLGVIGQVQDYVDSSPETFKPAVSAQ